MRKTQRTVVPNAKGKKITASDGSEQIIVIEEKVFHTFKNVRKGPFFFKRENGKEDMLKGGEEKDDFTDTEAIMLRKCNDYKNGWIIELTDEVAEPGEPNAFTNEFLLDFISKNSGDTKVLKGFVERLTNEFAIKRVKEAFIEKDLPVSLIMFCDYKLQQIEENYLKTQEAPIDNGTKTMGVINGE